ncbi:MAG: phage minor head protein [Terriglobales bacterium]
MPPATRQFAITAAAAALVSRRFQERLAELLGTYLAAFDLLGRLHVMQKVKSKSGEAPPLNTMTAPRVLFQENVLGFESVPFEGAIERLRNLTALSRAAFDGLKQQYKLQAFTIAGTSDVRLIEEIQQALVRILEQGGTLADFERAVNALTDEAGIERLASFQIETVFQTNIQRAYGNGRFEQMKDPAVAIALPFWKYVTAGDGRVRPNHALMDGFVARHDDLVWGKWYPPAGFNCRCTVVPILANEAPEGSEIPGLTRLPAEPDPGFGGML